MIVFRGLADMRFQPCYSLAERSEFGFEPANA
jgi:hypothetical protein